MSLSLKQLVLSLTLLAIGGGAGLLGSRYLPVEKRPFQQVRTVPLVVPPTAPRLPTEVSRGAAGRSSDRNFIAAAVQQEGPAVVRINATRKVANQIP